MRETTIPHTQEQVEDVDCSSEVQTLGKRKSPAQSGHEWEGGHHVTSGELGHMHPVALNYL
jgi:hypothetical protein